MGRDTAGTAVVVGNSDGIGLALTRRLLEAGWTVAGLSRRDNRLEHERYVHRVVDVTSETYSVLLSECADAIGPTDLCVYAAGIGEPVDVRDLASQTRTLDVNVMGAARTVEVLAPRMVERGSGHIVGLSSLADAMVSEDAPAYAASKAALSAYFLGLALALRDSGVTVTAVRLGFVDTKMAKSPSKPLLMSVENAVDLIMATHRTGRVVVTRPRRLALAARILGAGTAIRLRRIRRR